jgi:putative ABC transport system substrate-binding protein
MSSKKVTRTVWGVFTWVMIAILLLSGCAGIQPQKPKVYHVGMLSTNTAFTAIENGFKAKMTALGYIENQNLIYNIQTAKPSITLEDRIALAKKLVEDKVDLIYVSGSPDAVAAKAATEGTNIPVVFAYGQLEGTTLVKSVSQPGGNLTGVRYPGPEMITRRLKILLQIAPQAKRIWVGYDKNGPNDAPALDALRPAAESLGVTLVEVPATKMDDLAADLAKRAQATDLGIDAILTMPDTLSTGADNFAITNKFAKEHNIPVAGGIGFQAKAGALFINTTDMANVGALAASIADKVLKGTPPGTIPVVTPEQNLTINYKVAQQLGLTVPEGLLNLANEIIR